MRILFLSQRFLLPMDTGGKLRTGNILRYLSKTNDITLVSNVESPKDDRFLPQMHEYCSRFIPVPWREPKRYSTSFFVRLFFKLFSTYPVSALNDYSQDVRNTVDRECTNGNYDLAICDFVQSALNFQRVSNIPTILFQHNVESIIARRHFEHSENAIGRAFWYLQWKKMLAFEREACRSFDTVIAVSENDKELFEGQYGLGNVETIPTGVDTDYYYPARDEIEQNALVFCGSMDWLPNEDGIIYFSKDILPHIKKRVLSIKVMVVGRNPSPTLRKIVKECPGVELTGWVKDVRPYIARSALYIVPIRIGGGTRMKIYEAMAMGKTVISTTVGAEGLPVTNGQNVIIEDDPVRFGDRVLQLITDSEAREKIGKAAVDYVRENVAWQKVADQFSDICRRTLDKSKKGGR